MESSHCTFSSSMNLYLVVVGITGLSLNILSWIVCYTKIRRQCHQSSRDILLISLVLLDILTVSVPLPIYLSMYDACTGGKRTNFVKRPTICEMFYLMFVWFKLASLFVITTLNYTAYLAMKARGIYRSIGERLSSSFACSRYAHRYREKRNSLMVIANLVVGIDIVAFAIASLPYIGLGPEGVSSHIRDNTLSNGTTTEILCSIDRISYPQKNKEYTFLFAVLMSSSACFLLQIVHSVPSCISCPTYSVVGASAPFFSSRRIAIYNRRIGAEREFTKMICVLGLSFHLTWIPVMVAIGFIMSGYLITTEFSQYVIAASFLPPCLDPVFFAVFLVDFREGYKAVLKFIPDKLDRLLKDCAIVFNKPKEIMTVTSSTTVSLSTVKFEETNT
ncbi:uncharacterized protein [Montipora capricornis]|uniref:uncharacterized protein n=1 Tax=Montipora capricornis TaxID=246305 RepID=UPI0035F10009